MNPVHKAILERAGGALFVSVFLLSPLLAVFLPVGTIAWISAVAFVTIALFGVSMKWSAVQALPKPGHRPAREESSQAPCFETANSAWAGIPLNHRRVSDVS